MGVVSLQVGVGGWKFLGGIS